MGPTATATSAASSQTTSEIELLIRNTRTRSRVCKYARTHDHWLNLLTANDIRISNYNNNQQQFAKKWPLFNDKLHEY